MGRPARALLTGCGLVALTLSTANAWGWGDRAARRGEPGGFKPRHPPLMLRSM
jgi:hypothetical protein